jgi:hypothetical protein
MKPTEGGALTYRVAAAAAPALNLKRVEFDGLRVEGFLSKPLGFEHYTVPLSDYFINDGTFNRDGCYSYSYEFESLAVG